MLERFKGIIEKLENSRTPFYYFVLSFLFVTFVRSFFECFSDTDPFGALKLILITDYTLSYIVFATAIILLVHLVTKTELIKVAKVILPGFIVLISVPINDLIMSGGKGYDIAYLLPEIHGNLLHRFLTFFGEFYSSGMGATPGIRVEIAFVLLAFFVYFYIKKINFIKNLFSVFAIYSIIFSVFAVPYFISFLLKILKLELEHPQILTVNLFPLILFLIGILLFYFADRNYFKVILKDIRLFRLFHYEMMFFVGVFVAYKICDPVFTVSIFFSFLFVPISIVFAWLYSVMTNNIEDYEIDKISNQQRPLIKKEVDSALYNKTAWSFFFLALIYAGFVNFVSFFVILLFIGNYFLYSMPPFRLKRIPFFSKTFIALNSLVLVMLGFSIVSGVTIENIPVSGPLFFSLLLVLTAMINFIDIKDYDGDKKEGIKTLPVLLGLKRSKILISIFFGVPYLLVFLIAKDLMTLIIFFLLGVFQVYLINRVDYKEKYVFTIYLLSIFYLISKYLLF